MTKREFLDTVFALAPNEANAIMDAFDEYVDSNEPPANTSETPNSSDTISRAKAIAEVAEALRGLPVVCKDIAVEAIKQLPPAQPEIIRCKDCKHWIPYDWMFSEVWQSKNIADYPEDEIGCNYCDMAMKANDFCSRGERRTE